MQSVLLSEVSSPEATEASPEVAVRAITLVHLAVILYAECLVDSLNGLELLACRADWEDLVLVAIDDQKFTWSYQTCNVAHITQIHNVWNVVTRTVVNCAYTTLE